jgi:hypothetical protein
MNYTESDESKQQEKDFNAAVQSIKNDFFENKTLIGTWLDDEDDVQQKIARYIAENYTKGEELGKVKNPTFTKSTVLGDAFDFSIVKLQNGKKVIYQSGMPDNIWYCKEDEGDFLNELGICEKCFESFISHNDDGSCVED